MRYVRASIADYYTLIIFHLFQVLREGMGQASLVTDVLDTVITNALILDAVTGVVKADVGIKVRNLTPITKAGGGGS